MRIYDYDDALMYEEQLRDYISEDDTASPGEYEFPEVKKALPASSSRRSTQSGQLPDNGSLLRTRMAGMVPGSAGCVL
jgi:hypothetical protein